MPVRAAVGDLRVGETLSVNSVTGSHRSPTNVAGLAGVFKRPD